MLEKKLILCSLIVFNIILFPGHVVYAFNLNQYNISRVTIDNLDTRRAEDPELLKFRDKIDSLDASLLTILAERIDVVKKVGEYKKKHKLPVYQPDRYKELIKRRQKSGSSLGIDESFIRSLFNLIHDNSLNVQNKLNQTGKQ